MKSTEVEEGQKGEMRCAVSGHPAPTLQWLFNGEQLRLPSNNISVQLGPAGDACLTIDPVSISDEGEYSCQATNSSGLQVTTARLNVKRRFFSKNIYYLNIKFRYKEDKVFINRTVNKSILGKTTEFNPQTSSSTLTKSPDETNQITGTVESASKPTESPQKDSEPLKISKDISSAVVLEKGSIALECQVAGRECFLFSKTIVDNKNKVTAMYMLCNIQEHLPMLFGLEMAKKSSRMTDIKLKIMATFID